jgi:ABC-type antimicrobial peptide transport system permease subunit
MSKFVSESTKEIGIFRAIGFTRNNIITIFLSQAIIYTGFGYLIGIVGGVMINYLASSAIATWFSNFVSTTVGESVNVLGTIDSTIFTRFDLESIAILFIILVVITLLVAIIPAIRASNVSPVEAIKSE